MAGRSATGGYDPSGIDLDEWEILENQLEESIPNYDRVNRLMTFGQDAVWRKALEKSCNTGDEGVEVGCGPGSFAEDIEDVDLTCLDPSGDAQGCKSKGREETQERREAPLIMYRLSLNQFQ